MKFCWYFSVLIPTLLLGSGVTLLAASRKTRLRWGRALLLLMGVRVGLFHFMLFGGSLLCSVLWRGNECQLNSQWLLSLGLAALVTALAEALPFSVQSLDKLLLKEGSKRLTYLQAAYACVLGYCASLVVWMAGWLTVIGIHF
jgi:hypothetical protein